MGFNFRNTRTMKIDWMNPSNKTAAYKLACHKRQDNIPVIYVKMESLKQNMSCLENMSNVIHFFYGC